MIFQLVWATGDECLFEKSIPLLWHGEYLARQGWTNGIKLGFLEGIELLSADYRSRLEQLGYELIDCSSHIAACLQEYPALKTYTKTHRYWFLRWNVLDVLTTELAGKNTVIHLDADVVLMADPSELYRDVMGKTFVLQGCPVLTVISDREWFAAWRRELANFLRTPDEYIKRAILLKDHPVRNSREFCNEMYYVPGRFHDQDMLEYLIAAGILPQSTSAEVYESSFYWIQNPLLPGEWYDEQSAGEKRLVIEKDDVVYIDSKRVAMYHFQSDFAKYCRMWQQFARFGMGGGASLLKLAGPGRRNSSLVDAAGKLLDLANRKVSRRAVYEFAFQCNPATGNLNITDIVNSCWEY